MGRGYSGSLQHGHRYIKMWRTTLCLPGLEKAMSMWEIDQLLKGSIALVRNSDLSEIEKRNIVWNLEKLPERYDFDAGVFPLTEIDTNFEYHEINPFKLGEIIITIADGQNKSNQIYNWSAFLLNFWYEYFNKNYSIDTLKKGSLYKIKEIFKKYDFSCYEPVHASLTIYPDGNSYFSDEQNELIKWFVE